MVREIRLYIEGDPRKHTKPSLREGFHEFLKEIIDCSRQRDVRFRVIISGSRGQACSDFLTGIKTYSIDETFVALLVDSEGPLRDETPYGFLAKTECWQDTNPQAGKDQYHLMVECMESWFLADRAILRSYYGNCFRENRLSGNPNVERISKDDVQRGLHEATRETQKGAYHKTRHAPDLLRSVNPILVRGAAPHCARLFVTLKGVLNCQ